MNFIANYLTQTQFIIFEIIILIIITVVLAIKMSKYFYFLPIKNNNFFVNFFGSIILCAGGIILILYLVDLIFENTLEKYKECKIIEETSDGITFNKEICRTKEGTLNENKWSNWSSNE